MNKQTILIVLSLALAIKAQTNLNCLPNGIKLSLGDNFDKSSQYDVDELLKAPRHDYTITYSTKVNCTKNYIEVYPAYQKGKKFTLVPKITKFIQVKDDRTIKGVETRKQDFESYIYEYQLDAKVLEFTPDSLIQYSCFYLSDDTTQKLEKGSFEFYHPDYTKLTSREFKFAWIADYDINPSEVDKYIGRKLGEENMKLMDQYIKQDRKNYVAIVAGGDYAYDLMDDSGNRGEEFLKAGEFSYATIPYVTIAGNHEEWYDFAYYKSYFRNPRYSISQSDYYTLTLGELLLVGINTNKFIKDAKNVSTGLDRPYYEKLLKWLDNTLEEMKKIHRWIVVYSHQNLYCHEDFATSACYLNPTLFNELEELLVKHKVDIYLSGHVHAYERMHPFYNGQIQFSESDQCQMNKCSLYNSPTAPVYVVDGTGGTYHYFPKDSGYPGGKITVASDRSLGFSTVSVKNSTHLVFEHILSDNNFAVFDTFSIYKPLPPPSPKDKTKPDEIPDTQESSSDRHELMNMYIIFFVILGIVVAGNISLFVWFKNRLSRKHYQNNQSFKKIQQSSYADGITVTANQL